MHNRLDQAIRTLRAIQQRYEPESDAGSGRRRAYTVHVALEYADMRWIAAAIETLEKATRKSLSADSAVPPAASASPLPQLQPPSSHTSSNASVEPAP